MAVYYINLQLNPEEVRVVVEGRGRQRGRSEELIKL
jgi:hypothetical protein